jgi:putative phage-type endonuclease
MTAVLIPTSSEQEWLEARRQGITASEIPVIMGLSPYSSPYALYHRKLGVLPEQDDNDAMALGRYLEQYVADRFESLHPQFRLDAQARWSLYAHRDRPWQMASPDRILWEADPDEDEPIPLAVLEAKTDASYDGWGEDGTDQIPVHYRCQVLWQMDVLGVTTGYVACLFLHSRKIRVYELTLDSDAEADLKIMRDTASCFLQQIKDGDEPDVDWRPATTAALKRLHPLLGDFTMTIPARLAAWYRAACRDVKAAEKRKALYENRIREVLGTGRYANSPDGMPVARRDVYDLPEKTITRKASTVDKLVPAKPLKENPS